MLVHLSGGRGCCVSSGEVKIIVIEEEEERTGLKRTKEEAEEN